MAGAATRRFRAYAVVGAEEPQAILEEKPAEVRTVVEPIPVDDPHLAQCPSLPAGIPSPPRCRWSRSRGTRRRGIRCHPIS